MAGVREQGGEGLAVDIDGGFGTLLSYASKAKRELPNDVIHLDGPVEQLGKKGTFLARHVHTSRRGVAVQHHGIDEAVAAAIGEEAGTIEDVIEPYLIQQGFLQRTPRGRVLTARAWGHMGLNPPKDLAATQASLFEDE